MNNIISIILNENFFKYTIPFLNSLKKNWPWHPEILCHYDNLDSNQIEQLSKYSNLKLTQVKIEENEIGLCPPERDQHMLFAYTKLRLFSEAYSEYDNILYLDVDTLVLKPLDNLLLKTDFTIFIDPTPLIFKHGYKNDELKELLKEDGLLEHLDADLKTRIGNSGVMLIPKKYRTSDNYNYILYLLNRYKSYNQWADQSIINYWILKNNIKLDLDIKFNYISIYFNNNNQDLNELSILHFVKIKPLDIRFLTWDEIDKNNRERLCTLYYSYVTP